MVFVLLEMIMVIVTVIPANSNGYGSGFFKVSCNDYGSCSGNANIMLSNGMK